MNIKQLGLKLKKELNEVNNFDEEVLKRIATKIQNAKHDNGEGYTQEEKNQLINYLRFRNYDHETGYASITETDNSKMLELINLISQTINSKNGK